MKRFHFFIVLIIFVFFIAAFSGCSFHRSPISYVDPFIGTGGHGHTYPGPAMPFGMIQPGPDTRLTGWDGCSGYHYSDSVIYGFSHTHLSGTGIPDYCDILIMPQTERLILEKGGPGNTENGYASRFSHDYEEATPGYYSVLLKDDQIRAEITTSYRTALHRYTSLLQKDTMHLVLDLMHRDRVLGSSVKLVNDHEIEGYRRSTGWAKDQKVWFVMRFSKPVVSFGTVEGSAAHPGKEFAEGDSLKAWFTFSGQDRDPLLVKVAISPVDIDGARKNMEHEIPGWDFDSVYTAAAETWNKQLKKIEVSGGREQDRVKFYTALYHSCLNPNLYSDVDGRYLGHDGKIHTIRKGNYYTLFSLWDTFRGEHPLLNLIEPERTQDFVRTFLLMYEQGGSLPVWELSANETWTMIGYHAVPVITDAWKKGLRQFDPTLALRAMVQSADADREGLRYYREQGFIGVEDESESVSKTLEYAYDDWCIAEMAAMTGDTSVYHRFIRRAQYYKNLWDPQTGFMRGRVNGGWFTPFDPREVNFNYTEANAWQYTFFVPQDISGLMKLMGGEDAFTAKLDTLFHTSSETTGRNQADITGMIGQYAHGNEPSHHIAYLYSYAGKPWKTQEMVRRILNEQYRAAPDGLSGNEDAGQMSAWFVLSSMGFYAVTPGSDQYVLGSPLFRKIVLHMDGQKTFTIKAKGNRTDRPYIAGAKLDGKKMLRSFFTHKELISGGKLELTMSSSPSPVFGTAPDDRPFSSIDDHLIVPVPYMNDNRRTFYDSLVIEPGCTVPAIIRVTLDGTEPGPGSQEVIRPLIIRKTTVLKARAFGTDGSASGVVAARYLKIPGGRKVTLLTSYSPQYSAGGDQALADFIRGPANFRTGSWQGYEGVDLEAVVDLGKTEHFSYIGIGFLQDIGSWIFMPEYVEFFVSEDGKTFIPVGKAVNEVSPHENKLVIKEFSVYVYPKEMRYVKVFAKNRKTCPPWHPGAGGKAWLFADEIIIK